MPINRNCTDVFFLVLNIAFVIILVSVAVRSSMVNVNMPYDDLCNYDDNVIQFTFALDRHDGILLRVWKHSSNYERI